MYRGDLMIIWVVWVNNFPTIWNLQHLSLKETQILYELEVGYMGRRIKTHSGKKLQDYPEQVQHTLPTWKVGRKFTCKLLCDGIFIGGQEAGS